MNRCKYRCQFYNEVRCNSGTAKCAIEEAYEKGKEEIIEKLRNMDLNNNDLAARVLAEVEQEE